MERPVKTTATTGRDVFTTGQVAKICNVTIRTVIKWFESGRLQGYKIPDSKDRRIPLPNLLRFLDEHKIPYDPARFDVGRRLLIADDSPTVIQTLKDLFAAKSDFDVHIARNGYEAGFETARLRPTVLLIDYYLGDTTADQVLATLSRDAKLSATKVLVMTGYLNEEETERLRESGLEVFRKPLDLTALVDRVTALMAA